MILVYKQINQKSNHNHNEIFIHTQTKHHLIFSESNVSPVDQS